MSHFDEVDGALGSSLDSSNTKGVAQIVDYLKKCINFSSEKPKQNEDAFMEDEED